VVIELYLLGYNAVSIGSQLLVPTSCWFLAWLILQPWRFEATCSSEKLVDFLSMDSTVLCPRRQWLSLPFLKSKNWIVNSRVCLYIMVISCTKLGRFVYSGLKMCSPGHQWRLEHFGWWLMADFPFGSEVFYFLAYFSKVGLCDLHAVCVFVYPPMLTFECLNQSLWNLICISWHLSPSQQHTL
jgi:hypothetical protein